MNAYEVPTPILNAPYDEPRAYWHIVEGELPEQRDGRRPSVYYYRDQRPQIDYAEIAQRGMFATREDDTVGSAIGMILVNRIRERVGAWRAAGYPGVTRTTLELLQWWQRDAREQRLFFAQREAAETIIFLIEARADFLQGISVPRDEPSDERKAEGYAGFVRYACKMATGAGKTTVMGMLAAWSILNKQTNRSDSRFSDVVLIVCPNVTIRDRLRELDPALGEASLYITRDLVPRHLLPVLSQGYVLVVNWHVFEPQAPTINGIAARVNRTGIAQRREETITIGPKTTTARGTRYLTLDDLDRQIAAGLIEVKEEIRDNAGNLKKVKVESIRYLKSDSALINDVLGRDIGGKQNILVLNDEAHHAYRIRRDEPDAQEAFDFGDRDEAEEFFKEATVWIDGLDRIQKLRGINRCIDFSATPYFLGRVGQATNRPFPWVVSDFSLTDAIESSLVKIPQLAVRDTTGAAIPGYFNIWNWILPQLTPAERGGKQASPKPEAILKYAHHPIAMLGSLWEEESQRWAANGEKRPPVFILVCRNTQIAKVVYEWLAENKPPVGIPPIKINLFHNNGSTNTIRVDSKVVHETDTGEAKSDEMRWMRFTLDTVGKQHWPTDQSDQPLYPMGFKELAEKLERPTFPPGRDIRCIVSVGMLTEGWDANTVTHIIGLRPFMSQLLCEQVVGRGLRRTSYELDAEGKFPEEVAKVFGVPFEIIPFKANKGGTLPPPTPRHRVHALPAKAEYAIQFPRVEGYTQAIRNRLSVDWANVATLTLDPNRIPPETDVKALIPDAQGRSSLHGPGIRETVGLAQYRERFRVQEIVFDLAKAITMTFTNQSDCLIPMQVLFPQILEVVRRYVQDYVYVLPGTNRRDVYLSPYYGQIIETVLEIIRPDTAQGEDPEIPRYETTRGPGTTADVDFWTRRDVREVVHSHVNYVVADTDLWEQSAAYLIDTHPAVAAFVKNAGLGFAIPYLHNGQTHDFIPDFIIRLKGEPQRHLILEIKGYDLLKSVKRAAAARWVAAVNADGRYGFWQFALAERVPDVRTLISAAAQRVTADTVRQHQEL
ncbi:MAG: DEAD/DEAH box helicase family protein [Herpetosiphonaceae bacterium]|nr:DEAD/DEAH box helicase family protein [Herpetosiphonaceae bacterium]